MCTTCGVAVVIAVWHRAGAELLGNVPGGIGWQEDIIYSFNESYSLFIGH